MASMLVGAQLYSCRTHTQTEEGLLMTLQTLRKAGYRAVQLSAHGAQIPAVNIAEMLRRTGMICPATHTSFDRMRDDLTAVVREQKLWDSPYVGIGAMPERFHEQGEQGFRSFAQEMGGVARRLKDEGLTLIYHNHAFEMQRFGNITGLGILLSETDPLVQFEIDTYWIQCGGGDPIDWIHRVIGRMDVVHLKDMAGHSENRPVITEIGHGNLNWKAILEACDLTKVKWAFVEQDNAIDTDPFACLARSHDYLAGVGATF